MGFNTGDWVVVTGSSYMGEYGIVTATWKRMCKVSLKSTQSTHGLTWLWFGSSDLELYEVGKIKQILKSYGY